MVTMLITTNPDLAPELKMVKMEGIFELTEESSPSQIKINLWTKIYH